MTRRGRSTIGRRWRAAALAAVAAIVVVVLLTRPGGAGGKATGNRAATSGPATSVATHESVPGWLASLEARVKGQPGHLVPGSNPAVLPGPVLIADRNNNRLLLVDPKGRVLWTFPGIGSLAPGQTFLTPDDAFFGPHGRHIIAAQEDQATISVISVPGGPIVWHYGHTGVPGSAPGYLSNPDDAMLLPNGNVMTADIKNCRLLELSRTSSGPLHISGLTDPYCYHAPPQRFGSPNGMFPMSNGDWLVTEINGDWVDEMTPAGKIVWSVHPPAITYPSDTNEVSPGTFVTASYTKPGVIEEFTKTGRLLWRYAPRGQNDLNEPSLALPLPNGDILANADWSDRVVVIDPKTNKIVWQYGHTGKPGSKPGYLHKPDGVDLAPPHSLLDTHAATTGIPRSGVPGKAAEALTIIPPRFRPPASARVRPAAAVITAAMGLALAACSSGAGTTAPSGAPSHPASGTRGTSATTGTPGTSGPAPVLTASTASGLLSAPVARAVVLPDGSDLIVIGGLDSADQSTSGVFRLAPAAGTVTDLGSLAQATHDAAGAVLNGADVVFGGGTVASTASVQAWRPGSGGRLIGRLPTPRSDLAAATVGGTTYLLGGYDGTRWSTTVLATRNGTRFQVVAHLPVPVRYPAVAAIGGVIIVAGGQGRTGNVRTIQEINPAIGRAIVLGQLPAALADAAAVVLGGRFYVAGGQTGTTTSDRIWSIDPVTGTVTPAGTLPQGISNAGAATVGSVGYLVGGSSATGAPLDSVITLRAG